jgi:hypothetical protein
LSGVPPDGGIDEVVIGWEDAGELFALFVGWTGVSELFAPFIPDPPLSGDALETGGSTEGAVSVGPEK